MSISSSPSRSPTLKYTLTLSLAGNPLDIALERPLISDDVYRGTTAAAATSTVPIEWKLKELFLVYESTVLESKEEIARMSKAAIKYYVDIPRARLQKLSEGMRLTTNVLDVPKGTKAVLVAWVSEQQIFYNATQNKNLSARFTFPRDCTNGQFLLKGYAAPLIFSGGLEDLGLEKAFNSPGCRSYHSYLVRKGLYPRGVDSLFPAKGLSYDQVAYLDLSHRDLKDNTEMEVVLKFSTANSPKGIYLFAITLQQGMYTYAKGAEMKLEIQV